MPVSGEARGKPEDGLAGELVSLLGVGEGGREVGVGRRKLRHLAAARGGGVAAEALQGELQVGVFLFRVVGVGGFGCGRPLPG